MRLWVCVHRGISGFNGGSSGLGKGAVGFIEAGRGSNCARKFALRGVHTLQTRNFSPSVPKIGQNGRILPCWASLFAVYAWAGVCWASFVAVSA